MRIIFALLVSLLPVAASAQGIGEHAVGAAHVYALADDSLYDAKTFAPSKKQDRLAQATTSSTTTTQTPTEPSKVTTIVQGGTWAAAILDWIKVALVPVIGSAAVALFLKGMGWLGIQITAQQSSQLQNIAINGLNEAMDKLSAEARNDPKLSIDVKNQVIAEAVRYTQVHAKETLAAMGLDPQSGQAVEKIRAKILTVIADPTKPTPAALNT